jgi:hypothetical protein
VSSRSLGQIEYEAYGDNRGWKAYNDTAMPQWAAIPDGIKTAWEVAAERGAAYALSQLMDRLGADGVVAWLNKVPADKIADAIYQFVTDWEERARRQTAVKTWEMVLSLIASGTPIDGLKTIAQSNVEGLRKLESAPDAVAQLPLDLTTAEPEA